MSTNQESQSSARGLTRRRRLLRGCLVALAVVLVLLAVAWWIVSRHLGDMLSGVVREQADAAINGRLEFVKLEVDLAGRAVLTDAAVYPEDGETAWITCPRTVVGFDLFNLIGPNRGKQAITVTLQRPTVTLEREPDGRFNLAQLAKQREQQSKPLGLAVTVRDAEVDFSDWCLLDQAYPQFDTGSGLEEQLLKELGYDPRGRAEVAVHHELLGVSGTLAVNQQRQELAFHARVAREAPGGEVTAAGTATLGGATYDVNLGVRNSELTAARSYINALLPNLTLVSSDVTETRQSQLPLLAGRISHAQLRLVKRPAMDLELSGDVDCGDLVFLSAALPRLELPRLDLELDSGNGKFGTDLELHALGSNVQGHVGVDATNQLLSGKLAFACADPAQLAAQLGAGELPVSGAVNAQVTLAGSPAAPQLTAQLGSGALSYEELKLGKLSGTASFANNNLKLEEVKLSGGEVQLTVSGSYDPQAASGHFEAQAGPLPATQVLDLAKRLRPEATLPQIELAGSLSAAVELALTSGQTQVGLRAWSDRLTVAGHRFDNLDIKGRLTPPNLKIEEAVARYVGSTPLNLALFHSSGPLSIDLRAGGSVSTVPGQQHPALAIVGEGDTTNLSPHQVHLSFKALGPADDPELRFQIKTTHALSPLVLNAQGHYRQGFAPATATLSWHETKASFDGRVDLSKQLIDGQLQADEVDLTRFSGFHQLSGSLSLAATVGGSFSEPSLAGSLTVPRLTLNTDWRSYSVSDASADFELVEGNAISVSKGSFSFEDNNFTVAGRLGQKGSRLSLNCPDFNLLSALAMAQPPAAAGTKTAPTRPPLDVISSGPLAISLTGALGEPHAQVEYTSGPGQVEGHTFQSAVLSASVTRQQATVTKFNITGEAGNLAVSGELAYQPLSYTADATVHGFDLGILTPLINSRYVTGLAGNLDGAVKLSGGTDGYSADGQLTMRDGEFNNLPISEAHATFSSGSGTMRITDGLIVADGRVSLRGEFNYQPTSYALAAQFQKFNINPFLPLVDNKLLEGAAGRLDGTLELSGSGGEYNVDGDLQLHDGRFQGVAVSEARAQVLARGGRVDISKAEVIASGTQLTGEAHFGPKPADARVTAHASSLDLALLSPFIPDNITPLNGKLAVDLDLKPGRGQYPNLELTARSVSDRIGAHGISFSSLNADISLANDNLRLQHCELVSGQSSLYITAQLDLNLFNGQRNQRALPLDVTVGSNNFDLDDVTALLPESQRNLVPGGVFTCENLRLSGTSQEPQLNGTVTFDITRMPAYSPYLALVSRATGSVKFTSGGFDILRLELTPAGGGVTGKAVVKGSGEMDLYPFNLKSGTVDLILAEQNEYIFVNTNDIDPALLMSAGEAQAQLPINFSGWIGGTVHVTAPSSDTSDGRAVIGGLLSINTEGKTSEIEMPKPGKEEAEHTPAAFRFDARDGLRIEVKAGTTFLYDRGGAPGNLDLRAELVGNVTLRGVPGLVNPADPDALRIEGSLEMPEGSMKLYRHVVRLDPDSSRLKFTNSPGDLFPYLTARASLVLPRVLSGGETYTSTGIESNGTGARSERGDLQIFFTLTNHKLGPTSNPVEAVQLSSEPPLPTEQIASYLLGDAGSVLTGSGSLAQFAQGELQAFGTSFISRYIEDELNLAAFQIGGSGNEENPYYMDVEKELAPGFSVTYYRDFFSQSYQAEEYGVKYRILEEISGNRYNNVDLEMNFTKGGFRGTGSEFMFTWSTRF